MDSLNDKPMNIANIGSQTVASSGAGKAQGQNEMGREQFLQLLVAQMQNQDPMNPMDSQEFASQLAQFNTVEQLIGVNQGISSLRQSQNMMRISMNNSMATSLAGKQVKALSNEIHLEPAGNAKINYELASAAEQVEIIVRSESGSEIRRVTLTNVGAGESSWTWDGRNNAGKRMGEGNYSIEIIASSGDDTVNAMLFTEGIAEKVRYTGSGVMLLVNNVEVPIGDVEEVGVVNL